ncbi:hypothetical protein ACVOMT_11215 [Sphingomonas panni]|uniref:hypothetical protein n=1 Tax=Sphingomonas panni TaxID=237612 RepID=UPI001F5B301E|nr:hypothetical protein [Sphingomonas panni]
MSQPAQITTGLSGNRRGRQRIGIQRSAVLRVAGHPPIPITLVDLTRDGCLIETDAVLAADQQIELGIAGIGTVGARVVRSGTIGYGCEFAETLPSGAITNASRANVVQLETDVMTVAEGAAQAGKVSPRQRLLAVAAIVVLPWAAIAGIAALLG